MMRPPQMNPQQVMQLVMIARIDMRGQGSSCVFAVERVFAGWVQMWWVSYD